MFKKPQINSVDPDQTAPIGSTLFASMLIFVSNVRQLFAADDFSRQYFQMHFSRRFKGYNFFCAIKYSNMLVTNKVNK